MSELVKTKMYYISRSGSQYIVENNEPIIDEIKSGTMMGGFEIQTPDDNFMLYDDFNSALLGTLDIVAGLIENKKYNYTISAFNELSEASQRQKSKLRPTNRQP